MHKNFVRLTFMKKTLLLSLIFLGWSPYLQTASPESSDQGTMVVEALVEPAEKQGLITYLGIPDDAACAICLDHESEDMGRLANLDTTQAQPQYLHTGCLANWISTGNRQNPYVPSDDLAAPLIQFFLPVNQEGDAATNSEDNIHLENYIKNDVSQLAKLLNPPTDNEDALAFFNHYQDTYGFIPEEELPSVSNDDDDDETYDFQSYLDHLLCTMQENELLNLLISRIEKEIKTLHQQKEQDKENSKLYELQLTKQEKALKEARAFQTWLGEVQQRNAEDRQVFKNTLSSRKDLSSLKNLITLLSRKNPEYIAQSSDFDWIDEVQAHPQILDKLDLASPTTFLVSAKRELRNLEQVFEENLEETITAITNQLTGKNYNPLFIVPPATLQTFEAFLLDLIHQAEEKRDKKTFEFLQRKGQPVVQCVKLEIAILTFKRSTAEQQQHYLNLLEGIRHKNAINKVLQELPLAWRVYGPIGSQFLDISAINDDTYWTMHNRNLFKDLTDLAEELEAQLGPESTEISQDQRSQERFLGLLKMALEQHPEASGLHELIANKSMPSNSPDLTLAQAYDQLTPENKARIERHNATVQKNKQYRTVEEGTTKEEHPPKRSRSDHS